MDQVVRLPTRINTILICGRVTKDDRKRIHLMQDITHKGVIEQVVNSTVFVRIDPRTSACGSCAAANHCGALTSDSGLIQVYDTTRRWKIGEEVLLKASPQLFTRSILLAYLFPLILVIGTLFLGATYWNELGAIIASFVVLACYYIGLSIRRKALRSSGSR